MRPVEDIVAECLRRMRRGLVRPIWTAAPAEEVACWRAEASRLERMLAEFGLAVVRTRAEAK